MNESVMNVLEGFNTSVKLAGGKLFVLATLPSAVVFNPPDKRIENQQKLKFGIPSSQEENSGLLPKKKKTCD